MITPGAIEIAKKVLENKMRRIAERRGFRIEKSRRKDTDAMDFGGYILTDARTNIVIMDNATLDEIEIYIRSANIPERKNPRKAIKSGLTGKMEKR